MTDAMDTGRTGRLIGFLVAPVVAVVLMLLGPPEGLDGDAWTVAVLTLFMATWWITEVVPIPVTALLPIVVLPVAGVGTPADVTTPYANPLVFLFLGGFVIALAIQQWGLHRRMALLLLHYCGQRPDHVVGGFIAGSAGLSMWVSNTATAAMMLPIGLSVLAVMDTTRGEHDAMSQHRFSLALLLGIAFGANVGGMATLIGTPPNAILAGFMSDTYGVQIGFGQWMAVGMPVSLVLLLACWWALTRWAFPLDRRPAEGISAIIRDRRAELGPISGSERRVLLVFLGTALAWVFRPLLETVTAASISDAGIAITAAVALFLLPAAGPRRAALLDWKSTRELPWGVIILIGGGLSLGTAIEASGLAAAVAEQLTALGALPLVVVVTAVVGLTILLSHVASNTATAATLMPVVTSVALSIDRPPLVLAVAVALAASCAFMLPVATPPNAIIFGSERLRVADMAQAGWRVTLFAIPLILAGSLILTPWLLLR
ncbi:DASS family sodium-coupled anion symporter [Aquisalimonas sp. 2447]|uniref:SLC13 family permease n=1 Tax=Aquisalimonas sp. 2447 TaxID=2740807 RepID=UPI00143238C3|nr:DASS family sodium-coupled anion symporter [Aquisalimonas sp. 2447]QIT55324.1 DASS family sodium-coupled anion symporter [Aquisalimonas sp. 2447]